MERNYPWLLEEISDPWAILQNVKQFPEGPLLLSCHELTGKAHKGLCIASMGNEHKSLGLLCRRTDLFFTIFI